MSTADEPQYWGFSDLRLKPIDAGEVIPARLSCIAHVVAAFPHKDGHGIVLVRADGSVSDVPWPRRET